MQSRLVLVGPAVCFASMTGFHSEGQKILHLNKFEISQHIVLINDFLRWFALKFRPKISILFSFRPKLSGSDKRFGRKKSNHAPNTMIRAGLDS